MTTSLSKPTVHRRTLPADQRPPAIDGMRAASRLKELEARARREMEILGHNHDWVPDPSDGAYNVLIIGGGQAGLGAAFALQRHRIGKVKILDAAPADSIGCWSRYARMHTLRSPKNMKGIELDVPSLHTESWFRAKYGDEAWEHTTLVPRLDWHEYLEWYRTVTDADVDFETEVTEVLPPSEPGGAFTVRARRGGEAAGDGDGGGGSEGVEYRAQRVIFALGLDGGGGAFVPPLIRELPQKFWAHTEDMIDFSQFEGQRVLVVGGGASGFDNAGTALEAGAESVTLFQRSAQVATKNSLRWMEFPGMQERFFDLPDDKKWEFGLFNGGLPQPPTQASIWRAFAFDNFSLHEGTTIQSIEVISDGDAAGGTGGTEELLVTDNHGDVTVVDFIISATGYTVDLALRPELQEFVGDIQLWSDQYSPAAGHPMGKCPYLGDGFQFQPKAGAEAEAEVGVEAEAGADPAEYIPRLYHFSTGARASHGLAGNQLSGIYAGITRMSARIATDIMAENWDDFFEDFKAFEHVEVTNVGRHKEGDPWYPQQPRY